MADVGRDEETRRTLSQTVEQSMSGGCAANDGITYAERWFVIRHQFARELVTGGGTDLGTLRKAKTCQHGR